MRDITTAVQTEITQSAVEPFLLCKLSFDAADGGDVNLWTGVGDLSWNSETWAGTGTLGAVSPVTETESTQAEGVTLSLTGIPSAHLAYALDAQYQGRSVTLYLGFLNNGSVIADPVQMFVGYMDVMTIDESAEDSTISIQCESRLADLLKPRERRYTHEDQQIDYPGDAVSPGDMGFEFIADLQNKEILWGLR